MALNYLAVVLLNIDVEKLMALEIERKGELRVFIDLMWPMGIALVVLLVWVKYIHKQSIVSLTTSRDKIDWKRVFFSFSLWAIITSTLIFVDYKLNPEDYQWNFELSSFLGLLVAALILVPLQTSFEEYLFRGYLMQGVGIATKSSLAALLFTSFLFGIMHIANPEVEKIGYGIMVYYIGTGLFLGITALMDDGIELCLGFHAANNLVTALLVTSTWTALQTPSVLKDTSTPGLGWDVFVPVLVVFPILLFIFSKIYKWTDWKEKLTGKIEKPVTIQ
ncbi:CPBP family intramembrane metalloprotease [Joostella atrarenae]|uniref:CPBP family intramembrane metalloprotease n=2 Tax=Flavobacteriaceae TaxID=49546 RepID=A0ABS9J1M9_9FLAO|nr:CPBP family intramembrane metalloprotease [Joostella atrarenae]